MKPPVKQGQSFVMKDGRILYIHMVHRPGNGWGVSASGIKSRDKWLSNFSSNDYYPWHKLKRMIDHESIPNACMRGDKP